MKTDGTSSPPRGWERFAPELTLGEARARLFALGGLGEDGGYGEAWVRLRLWRIPLAFPNTEGRRRAVRLHDIHHVLTGYPTDWRGEFEIAAWEIATGIGRQYCVAWLLDLLGFACGLVVFPRSVYRAFLRGRGSANLYLNGWDDALLTRRVGEMRRQLKLDAGAARPTLRDKEAFVLWSAASVLTYLAAASMTLLPLLVALGLLWLGRAT